MTPLSNIRELGRDVVAYGISSVLTSALAILLIPLYTRVLSPADYGLVALVTSLAGIVATFVVLGLDSAAGRWYFDDADDIRRRQVMSSWFWCQLGVSSLAAGVMIALGPWLAPKLSSSPDAQLALNLAALAIPLATFRQVAGLWLRCERLAWRAASFLTAGALSVALFSVVFVLVLDDRVPGVFFGRLVGAGITGVLAVFVVGRQVRLRYFSRPMLASMVRFGLPLVPTAIAGWVTLSSDRIVLKVMVGERAVGIYSVGASLGAMVALFTVAFEYAWGPFAFARALEPAGAVVIDAALSWFTLTSCFIASVVSVFAPEALRILTTPSFYGAASVVPYLAFSYVAMGVLSIVAIGANVAKKSSIVAASIFCGAAVNIVLSVALIPTMGRDGAGAATLLAYVAAAGYMYRGSQRHHPIDYNFRPVVMIAAWSAVVVVISATVIPGSGSVQTLLKALICSSFALLAVVSGLIERDHIAASKRAITTSIRDLLRRPARRQ